MRKFATCMVLILAAYIAGSAQHFGLDKSLAFIAPAVSYITAAGDAIWSVVRPIGKLLADRIAEFDTAACKERPPTLAAWLVGAWLLLSVACAVGALAHGRAFPGFSLVKRGIWDNRPTVDGRRTLPLWLAALIPLAAVIEFGSRLCYFAGFTVVTLFVTLFVAPFKVLVGLLTCDLSRPFRCLAAFVVVSVAAAAAIDASGVVASASGIRVGMKVETQNAMNTGLYSPAEIVCILHNTEGLAGRMLVELKFSDTGRCFRYADEFRVL